MSDGMLQLLSLPLVALAAYLGVRAADVNWFGNGGVSLPPESLEDRQAREMAYASDRGLPGDALARLAEVHAAERAAVGP